MRSYKSARRAAHDELEAIEFEVTYFDDLGEEVTEKFRAVGEISAATLTDGAYFADVGVATAEGAAVVRRAYMELIGSSVEFRRFWSIAPRIDEDTLIEIMADLIEEVLARPTERPSDSSPASSTTGQPSRVVSLPPGSETPDASSA